MTSCTRNTFTAGGKKYQYLASYEVPASRLPTTTMKRDHTTPHPSRLCPGPWEASGDAFALSLEYYVLHVSVSGTDLTVCWPTDSGFTRRDMRHFRRSSPDSVLVDSNQREQKPGIGRNVLWEAIPSSARLWVENPIKGAPLPAGARTNRLTHADPYGGDNLRARSASVGCDWKSSR
jgi:hypothetical protein